MYKFADTTEVASVEGSSIKTMIDGVVLDEYLSDGNGRFRTLTVGGRDDMNARVLFDEVGGRDGVVENSFNMESKEIYIKYLIEDTSNTGFRKRVDDLNQLIFKQLVNVYFDDEEYYRKLTFLGNEIGEEESNSIVATMQFLASDPYKYSIEESEQPLEDISMVENKGTEITYPTLELTAKKQSTFAMINNANDEYMLLGVPSEVYEEAVKERDLILSEYGDTLASWNSINKGVDKRPDAGGNGKITGSFNYDGTGLVVGSYGTGSNWHGPAVTKQIPATQDFEIEMMLRAKTTNPGQTFRIEFYMLDEAMAVLGKMSIVNSSSNAVNFKAEARHGDFEGHRVNYHVDARNYTKRESHFHGMLRVKRIGKRFEFYVARTGASSGGKHYDAMTKTFNDALGIHQGKLRYIQIHIAKYGTSSNPSLPRINSLRVYKHNKVLVDQTPYIVNVGDVIEIDHDKEAVLLNGENAMQIKNFGAEFFGLHSGYNQLDISPSDTFETSIKYREKYK